MTAEEIQRLIRERAAVANVPAEPFLAMAKNETNYGQAANRPGSQYQGVMQMGKAASAEVGLDRKLVNDPVANIDAAIRLAKKNSAYLGIPISQENAGVIYAAHQQGKGAVKNWLSADPNTPIANIITTKHANANGMAGMTVAQAKAKWIDGTQKLADQWAGITSKQDLRQAAIASGDSVANPQSQLSAVTGYTQDMIRAAQKLADNNLASVNNFGWNPTVEGSQAQNFSKAVQNVTEAQTAIANKQVAALSRLNPDGTEKSFGQYAYDHILGARSENINSRALAKIQAEQSVTGESLAKQVANMKATMEGTVINPVYLDKAASNLTSQQQAENQTYNAVTGNANTQQQLKQQNEAAQAANAINQQQVDIQKGKLELEVNAANAQRVAAQKAAEFNADMNSRVQIASKGLGFDLPANTTYDQAMQLIVDPTQKAMFASKVLNGGANANNVYDAVKIGTMPGASDSMRNAANKYSEMVNNILNTPEALAILNGTPNKETGQLEGGVSDPAQRDAISRTLVSKHIATLAAGEGSYKVKSGANNPYSMYNRDPNLFNNIKLPEGATVQDLPNAVLTMQKVTEAGLAAGKSVDQLSTELANTYSAYRSNIQGNIDKDGIKLPPMKLTMAVPQRGGVGKPLQLDLTSPTDVKLAITKMKFDTLNAKGSLDFWKFLKGDGSLEEFNTRATRQSIQDANIPIVRFSKKETNIADKK